MSPQVEFLSLWGQRVSSLCYWNQPCSTQGPFHSPIPESEDSGNIEGPTVYTWWDSGVRKDDVLFSGLLSYRGIDGYSCRTSGIPTNTGKKKKNLSNWLSTLFQSFFMMAGTLSLSHIHIYNNYIYICLHMHTYAYLPVYILCSAICHLTVLINSEVIALMRLLI